MFVTSDTNIVSLKNMKWNQLSEAVSIFHEERETLTHHEVASGTELIGIINNIPEVNDEIDMTSSTLNANTLWEHQEKTVNLSDAAIAFINSLKLLPLCDHILQATDAGPGVGVTKNEVKYRDTEMSRINSWTHIWRGFTGHHTIEDKTKRSVPRLLQGKLWLMAEHYTGTTFNQLISLVKKNWKHSQLKKWKS